MPQHATSASTSFVLAGVQFRPVLGDIHGNIEATTHWIREAVGVGAKFVVLPEAASAGYMFRDRDEASLYAQSPEGETITAWRAMAQEFQIHIAGGFIERDDRGIYNSAVLIGPHGVIGRFRKAHLWNAEQKIYDRNEDGFPVFDTPLGRIGIGICYDAWFPETFRSVALQGADLLVLPANWVPVPDQPDDGLAMANMMCMTGAHSNNIYVAGISRVGSERQQDFIGSSVIVNPLGWPLAGPASKNREELVIAEVDLIGSRDTRFGNPFNQPIDDRRPELYVGDDRRRV